MAVFGGNAKITRAVNDPGTDDTLPSPGALSWGGITSASGVAGTTGAEAKLVHGDRWQQIDGAFTESVGADLKTTVMGGKTVTVTQDHNETVMGNTLQTMIGPQIVTNMNVRNETRAVTHLHTHGDNFFQYGPDNAFHYCETNMGAWIFMFETEVEHTEVALHHLEFKIVGHNYFSGIETAVSAIKSENEPMSLKAALLALHLMTAKADVKALEAKVGVLQPNIVACAPMAGVDPNPTPLI
jgi:hypothetical protein